MRDALPMIAERDARGETAAIYADIRETLRLPVVNLVWRHLATVDGGLRFAWDALRPVYASGAADAAGARLVARLALPRLSAIPPAVLTGAGVGAQDLAVIAAILDGYNRGNAQNLCALSALLCAPAAQPAAAPPAPADAPLPAAAVAIPPLPELESLPGPVQALVWQCNGLGQPPGDRVLASAWKHLAPWPGFLALGWALLDPLAADGRLQRAIGDTRAAALDEGAHLAAGCAAGDGEAGAAVRAVAAEFVECVIVRMVPVLQMLRRALPQ